MLAAEQGAWTLDTLFLFCWNHKWNNTQYKKEKRRRNRSDTGQEADSPATVFTLRANLAWPNPSRSALCLIKCWITQNELKKILPLSLLSSHSRGEKRLPGAAYLHLIDLWSQERSKDTRPTDFWLLIISLIKTVIRSQFTRRINVNMQTQQLGQ